MHPSNQELHPDFLRQRLRAILAADAVGFTRLMAQDDRGTLQLLDQARTVFRREVERAGGRLVDTAGDSVVASFESASAAVRSALATQAGLDPALRFRIGVHLGDVIEKDDGSVYGDGVNIAARLQALAEPGGVLVSHEVHSIVAARRLVHFDDLGEHRLKNFDRPVRVWAARTAGVSADAAAEATSTAPAALRFGRCEIQPIERRLLVDGEPATIGARAFDLLLALAAQPGELITKNQLLDVAWPGLVVEENNLAVQISALRKVLGGDVIVTIPGRGYRFAARPADASPQRPAASADLDFDRDREPPPSGEAKLKTNLPQTLPALLGRAEDLAALGALIDKHPLVSIVGAGGMGKSLLTQHLLASRRSAYAHGVCWVELGTVTDPALLPGAVAAALGVQLGGSDAMAGLCSAVAPLQLLVALDNAEQLLDGVAQMASALLAAAPGLRLVVTTQATLKLAQELVYRIGPLSVPPGPLPAVQALGFSAVALFAERAHLADSRFELTDANAPSVIELCRALDGLALAIELAAARAPMLGVQRLLTSMHDRLRLLTTSRNRSAPPRQQTLRAAMEWSHGFLDEPERAVFRRLAVFAGSGSLSMIQQVLADPADEPGPSRLDEWAVLDALAQLVDRSLVSVLVVDGTTEPRYRLLDSPRAYALEQLQQAGEETALRRRHMSALAAYCEAAWHEFFSGRAGWEQWLRSFALEAENAREAMLAASAAGERVPFLQIGATRMRAAREMPTAQRKELGEHCMAQIDATVPPALQVRAWMQVANALADNRPGSALQAARKALAAVQQSAALQADVFLCYQACCRFVRSASRGSAAAPEIQAALEQARALEDPRWPPHRRFWRAECEFFATGAGSSDALRLGREMLALELAAGGSGHLTRSNLVDAELAAGDARAAAATGEALLADLMGGRAEKNLAFTRINLAAAWLALDEAPRVRSLAQAGWRQARLFELQVYWADYLALLAALESRPRAAALLAGYSDAVYAAREETREPNEAAAHARASALARACLGDDAFQRLFADGRLLNDEQLEAVAFGSADA